MSIKQMTNVFFLTLNLTLLILGIILGWGGVALTASGFGSLFSGAGVAVYWAEKNSKSAQLSARETMAAVAEIENRKNKTVYDCRNYEDMTLQLRFVEAGISERVDLPICEDKWCPLCSPERERREDVSRTKKAKAENIRKVKIAAETKEKRERFENMAYASPKPLAENVWKAYKEKYGYFRGMSYYDYLIKYRTARDNGIDVAAIATDNKKTVELKKCLNCGMLTDNRLVCRFCLASAVQFQQDNEEITVDDKPILTHGDRNLDSTVEVDRFLDSATVWKGDEYWHAKREQDMYRNNPCSDAAGHELAVCDCDYEEIRVSNNKEIMRKYYRA